MYPFIDLGMIKISVFPIIIVLAIYSCFLVYLFSSKYDNYYFQIIQNSLLYCLAGAAIFGKFLFLLTRIDTPNLSILDRLGGFVFYGGLIGAVVGLYIYSKKKWDRVFDLLDVFSSILPLGQSIGRIGCYLNGCCYGKPYEGLLAVRYIIDGQETFVFPTWFIESIFCFLLFMCMYMITRNLYSGTYVAIYLMSYSLFRFVIEYFRGDSLRGMWYGMSTSQYISILMFIVGIAIFLKAKAVKKSNLLIKRRSKNANKYVPSYL